MSDELDELSTTALAGWLDEAETPVVLWPLGSTEPHGPHLPLATDVILAEENARRAARALTARGVPTLVAPVLPYGVTEFAEDFAGAITVPEPVLVDLIVAVAGRYLSDGFSHVCLVNHHLEPGQLRAINAAVGRICEQHGAFTASAPRVTSKRWGRRLTPEFKSGACHAGCYEGSLVLASRPDLVDQESMKALPNVDVSLSAAISAGTHNFRDAGMSFAYTGQPSQATAEEGHRTYAVLTEMVITEVLEHLHRQENE